MKLRSCVGVLAAVAVVCSGCATTQVCPTIDPDFATVSVRFVTPPENVTFADNATFEPRPRMGLTIDESDSEIMYDEWLTEPQYDESNPHHVVLWGGPFYGTDMTYTTASLVPGQYMFGVLNQDEGTAYQGWINVNNMGDNLVSMLTEWRDTVRDQKLWLGFENKIDGKFSSRDDQDFKRFTHQLKDIKRLERRIDRALEAEKRDFLRCKWQRAEVLSNAEVLLIPGAVDFFSPSTQPTFNEEELNDIRCGKAMTKVVLVADYDRAVQKLQRVTNLRDDLKRYRSVMVEEINRLQRQKRFLTITDHLYRHDQKFVQNEERTQKAHRIVAQIDQLCDTHRQHAHALAFIAGLFSPDQSYDAFDADMRDLHRDRIVLEEQQRQIDVRFHNTAQDSPKRITLERERQNLMAAMERIDTQLGQIGEARLALGKFRDSTTVIHRHGPARVLTTMLYEQDIPAQLVNAIERESLMTVRMQATDSVYTPPNTGVAQKRGTGAMKAGWRD